MHYELCSECAGRMLGGSPTSSMSVKQLPSARVYCAVASVAMGRNVACPAGGGCSCACASLRCCRSAEQLPSHVEQ